MLLSCSDSFGVCLSPMALETKRTIRPHGGVSLGTKRLL